MSRRPGASPPPPPRPTRLIARLAKPLRGSIRAGHPWIYDRALRELPTPAVAGDVVAIWDEQGAVCAALIDPGSPIRARVLDVDPDAVIDAAWARGRARLAAARAPRGSAARVERRLARRPR